MRIIVCTQEQFNLLNKKANEFLKCDNWCDPIIHPKTKEIGFTVKDRMLDALSSADKKEIIDLTSDWSKGEL